ncbi:MAG: hypothetical protein KGL39_58440 [Patescibacteria group bacterium]|nr:hypothetical protein [Patescibacteria group bacterium]
MWSIFGTPKKIDGHDVKADTLKPERVVVPVERPQAEKEKKENGPAK